ncbi:type I methionyl aminopeptidase [Patescibacteria group bacterium]
MIYIKTPQEIEIMAEGGHILSGILDKVGKEIKPGVTTGFLDEFAENLIIEKNGISAFKNYRDRADEQPFPTTLCASINEEIVHAPAKPSRRLKTGDIIGVDIGMQYKGYFTDMARTFPVGKISRDASRLLKITKKALELGIKQVKPGNYISDISKTIQNFVEKNGYSVVRALVGHGVGKYVHEPPAVPNFILKKNHTEMVMLKQGMTIAIEPMVNIGEYQVDVLDDGWTAVTKDGSLSAHFEHSVAVTDKGNLVLTK